MSIRNLFQKTKKAANSIQYDELPQVFRVQVVNIWQRLFAKHLILEYPTARFESVPEFFSEAILREIGEAHGTFFRANWGHNDFPCLANYFLGLTDIEKALQVIQISFNFAEEKMRPFLPSYRQLGCQDLDGAIADLNQRFQQHNIGYRYIDRQIVKVDLKKQSTPRNHEPPGATSSMKVFISHSSADKYVAEAFVNLIRASLRLAARDIRCTSVDGYRLPGGADAADQLRQEVFESEVFVALLSPTSIASMFVMFELGARWGARKHLIPVLVRGLVPSALKPPLSAIHAVNGAEQGQLHQLLEDIASTLDLKLEPAAAYLASLEGFRKAATD